MDLAPNVIKDIELFELEIQKWMHEIAIFRKMSR